MKNASKKILSLVFSIMILMSSIGFTTASAFDYDSFRMKTPFVISSVLNDDGGVQSFINIAFLKVSPKAKRNTKSAAKKSTGNSISFLNLIKKLTTKKADSKKVVTTKKATTKKAAAKKIVTTKKVTTKKATTKKVTTKKAVTTKKTTTTRKATTTTKKATTTTKKATTTTKKTQRPESINCSSAFLNEAMNALNKARKSAGTGNLRVDSGLAKAASVRAKELNRKFDHTRPNGGKFYTVFADCGVTKPNAVAENIAAATRFDNATDIVNLWLGSSGHRANIVNGKYTRFGMAWYINGNGKEYAVIILGN